MVKLYISHFKNKEKPNQTRIKKISSTIIEHLVDVNLEDFAEQLTEQGKTVVLAELSENKLSKATPIVSQELVMLDFDNKGVDNYTIEDLEQDLFIQNHALFYYKTFSDTESTVDKFRVVFKLEQPVTNNHTVESIYKALFKRYPMSDTSVGQTSRMFYGSNNSYELLDWDNVVSLEDLELVNQTDLVELNNSSELIDLNTPIYLLLKYKQYDLVKQKMGNIYSQEFPDDISAMNYFCSIDMKELLEFPEGNPFIDIFHNEESPSASVFYSEDSDMYFYKCFSNSSPYVGNIIQVILDYLDIDSNTKAIRLLVDITNSKINYTSDLGIQKADSNVFRKNLMNGVIEKTYPELYSYLKRYTQELNATLDFLYDYSYKDKQTGEIRYLSYFSVDKLTALVSKATKQRISNQKMWNILNIIIVTEMIQKLPENKIPVNLYKNLIQPQKKDSKQIRTSNIYEPAGFDKSSMDNMAQISRIMKENNVTISSLSYELIYRLFGEEKAKRDFPQSIEPLVDIGIIKMSSNDSNITKKSMHIENLVVKYIFKDIDSKGYSYEKDVIKKVARAKKITIKDVQNHMVKIRADISNKYNLNRESLTLNLHTKLDIKEKYSRSIVYYK